MHTYAYLCVYTHLYKHTHIETHTHLKFTSSKASPTGSRGCSRPGREGAAVARQCSPTSWLLTASTWASHTVTQQPHGHFHQGTFNIKNWPKITVVHESMCIYVHKHTPTFQRQTSRELGQRRWEKQNASPCTSGENAGKLRPQKCLCSKNSYSILTDFPSFIMMLWVGLRKSFALPQGDQPFLPQAALGLTGCCTGLLRREEVQSHTSMLDNQMEVNCEKHQKASKKKKSSYLKSVEEISQLLFFQNWMNNNRPIISLLPPCPASLSWSRTNSPTRYGKVDFINTSQKLNLRPTLTWS